MLKLKKNLKLRNNLYSSGAQGCATTAEKTIFSTFILVMHIIQLCHFVKILIINIKNRKKMVFLFQQQKKKIQAIQFLGGIEEWVNNAKIHAFSLNNQQLLNLNIWKFNSTIIFIR